MHTENTIHNTKSTTSGAAFFSYQAFSTCVLHSEVWFCVSMGHMSKSTFYHLLRQQQSLEFDGSYDHPGVVHFYPVNYRELSICLSFWQNVQLSLVWEQGLEAHSNPINHWSTQLIANFLETKKLVLWARSCLEEDMFFSVLSHKRNSQLNINVYNCQFSIENNTRHTASKINRLKLEGRKFFYGKAND